MSVFSTVNADFNYVPYDTFDFTKVDSYSLEDRYVPYVRSVSSNTHYLFPAYIDQNGVLQLDPANNTGLQNLKIVI